MPEHQREEGELFEEGGQLFRIVHGKKTRVAGELFEMIDGKPEDARFHAEMLGDDDQFCYCLEDLPENPTEADFDRARELYRQRKKAR